MIIGSKISEFHSGYRSYKVEILKKINFEKNTDYFHFDSEIIIQMLKLNYVIKEDEEMEEVAKRIERLLNKKLFLNNN